MNASEAQPDRRRPSTAGTIAYLLIGPIVWAAHLTVLYFSQSMLCAHGLAGGRIAGIGIVPAIIAAATFAALAILFAAILAPGATARAASVPVAERAFHRRVMVALAILSALAVVWGGLTAFFLPDCPQLR